VYWICGKGDSNNPYVSYTLFYKLPPLVYPYVIEFIQRYLVSYPYLPREGITIKGSKGSRCLAPSRRVDLCVPKPISVQHWQYQKLRNYLRKYSCHTIVYWHSCFLHTKLCRSCIAQIRLYPSVKDNKRRSEDGAAVLEQSEMIVPRMDRKSDQWWIR